MHRTLLLFVAILTLPACTPRHLSGWDQLARGMSEQQVRELLGEPRAQWAPNAEEAAEEQTAQAWWSYGVSGLLGVKAAFDRGPDGPQGDAYVVWFDESGHVVDYQRPIDDATPPSSSRYEP